MAQTQKAPTPNDVRGPTEGLDDKMDGLGVKTWIWIGVAIAGVVLGFGAWWTYALDRGTPGMDAAQGDMGGRMGGTGATDAPRFPAVTGFYAGEEILFIHTETSDSKVADMLTGMMGSPVITVPELADVPESALSGVYVFTNGVEPEDAQGPMGFQPDVFDSAPGDDDYSPLRSVLLVTWKDGAEPRVLQSAAEVEQVLARGEITVEEAGAVVNMPFLTWPGGER
jgi:hypothetical protein